MDFGENGVSCVQSVGLVSLNIGDDGKYNEVNIFRYVFVIIVVIEVVLNLI